MINVAVIGCGYWGPNFIRIFRQLGSCQLKAVCDQDQARLVRIAEMSPDVHVTQDYRDLLEMKSLDAVVVATPIHTHYNLSRELLKADKHVLVEKPLSRTTGEAQDLIRLARERNRTLMVGHTFEYSPAIEKIRELILSEEIGRLSHIEGKRHNLGRLQTDFSVIWDLAPHDISILLYTTKCQVKKVRAITHKAYLVNNADSIAEVDLVLEKNISVHLSMSWLYPIKVREMTFIGTKKMISYDDTNAAEKIRIHDKSVDSKIEFGEVVISDTIYREGDVHIPYLPSIEPLRIQCADFIDSIINGRQPRASGEVGLEVVKVLEAIEQSVNIGGGWVEVSG